MNFNVLPSLIALAILVVVFRAILRQGAAERLQLWLTAWILVLIHFVAQFLDVGHGLWDQVASAVSMAGPRTCKHSFPDLDVAAVRVTTAVSCYLAPSWVCPRSPTPLPWFGM